MANQLKLVATISPAYTAVEASTDNGVTYRAIAMTTVGAAQEGILPAVVAGPYATGTVKLRAVGYPNTVQSIQTSLAVVDIPPQPYSTSVRCFTFDGTNETMASRHYLAGDAWNNFTTVLPYTYTPPAGTMLTDACLWEGNAGQLFGAHSGYLGPSNLYYGTTLVVFQADTKTTNGTINFSVVASIDMSLPGRIPNGIGNASYVGMGPNPLFSSPEYVPRPAGRAGLFFMYQPNGVSTSNSYILYIESLDRFCNTWGNAVLISGAAMPYDNGGGNVPGSYIDPYYFYRNGKHMLVLRGFTSINQQSTCLGLRIVSSATSQLGPYDTVESNLFTVASGGANTHITASMEGQFMEQRPDGALWLYVDDYANGGIQYSISPAGSLDPAAFGAFALVSKPTSVTYALRHMTPVRLANVTAALATPTIIEETNAGWTFPLGLLTSASAANASGGTLLYSLSTSPARNAIITFTGTSVGIYTPSFGSTLVGFEVWVDNVLRDTVLYQGTANVNGASVVRSTISNMTAGSHVLELRSVSGRDFYVDAISI